MTHNETAGYWRAGQKASMSILTLEMNSLSQFCYSFMYLMILLFWLRPNLANIYSKIFSFIARARIFKALEVSFLSAYIFQEYQDKCSSTINEVKIDLLSKKSYFFTKSARARALLLRSVQNQKMHIIYITLSSHAKNQPPRTMLSYVYTLFQFSGE